MQRRVDDGNRRSVVQAKAFAWKGVLVAIRTVTADIQTLRFFDQILRAEAGTDRRGTLGWWWSCGLV